MSTLPRSLLIGVDTLAGWGGQTPGLFAFHILYVSGRNQFYSKEPQTVPMAEITIVPEKTKKVPYDTDDETPNSFLDELYVVGNTAEVQVALGAPLEVDPETTEKEKKLIEAAINKKKAKNLSPINTAFAAAAFLRTYGAQLALDAASARAAITNKLMELANCGDPKFELKALELLGKHSDIGLFTERSEVTINYKNPEDLEAAIKERVKRLLKSELIDITPAGFNLDDEFGVAGASTFTDELQAQEGMGEGEPVELEVEEDDANDANDYDAAGAVRDGVSTISRPGETTAPGTGRVIPDGLGGSSGDVVGAGAGEGEQPSALEAQASV